MAKIKAFTDLDQSKKLAEILPIESADMWWNWLSDPFDEVNGGEYVKEPLLHKPVCNPDAAVPCWSLAALLNILPHCIDDGYDLVLGKLTDNKGWYVMYDDVDHFTRFYVTHSDLIDACIEMIVKLKEKDLI